MQHIRHTKGNQALQKKWQQYQPIISYVSINYQKAYINKNNFLIHFVTLINSTGIYFQNIDSVRKGVTV